MGVSAPQPSAWVTHPWVAAGQQAIRFGIAYGPQLDQPFDWSALIDFVQAAETLGFDSYWTADHPTRWPDCWAALLPVALRTKSIRLGPLVSCIYYRSPALLARLAADVDGLSEGRLIFGIGMGDSATEFEKLQLPLLPVRERQQALEESLQIVLGLWGGEPVTFEGEHFRVRGATIGIGPVQRPRVPVLIAGGGERITLRQVARYADMSNFGPTASTGSAFTLEDVQRKVDALRTHCGDLGRPFDSVVRSHWSAPVVVAATPAALRAKLERIAPWIQPFQSSMVAGLPHEVAATYRSLAAAGMQYFTAAVIGNDVDTLRLLAEQVLPELTTA